MYIENTFFTVHYHSPGIDSPEVILKTVLEVL